jgi:hypothetical protein
VNVVAVTNAVVVVRVGQRHGRVEVIRFEFIDRAGTAGHTPSNLSQLLLGVPDDVDIRECLVIPMIASAEFVVIEWVRRIGHEYGPEACGLHRPHGRSIVAISDLIIPATPDKIVGERIEGKQNPNAALGVGVQHHDVAVVFRPQVDPYAVTKFQIAAAVQPHLNGLVL